MNIKVKALYTLIGLANKAKNLHEYSLANLTFAILLANGACTHHDFVITYEGDFFGRDGDKIDEISTHYDILSISLFDFEREGDKPIDVDRRLSIPVPLLVNIALIGCMKYMDKKIRRLEHNRRFKDPVDWAKSYEIIFMRYLKIFREYFDVESTIKRSSGVVSYT